MTHALDREKVLAVLVKRFPHARPEERAAAANAILGLEEDWEEITDRDDSIRLFRRRHADTVTRGERP